MGEPFIGFYRRDALKSRKMELIVTLKLISGLFGPCVS